MVSRQDGICSNNSGKPFLAGEIASEATTDLIATDLRHALHDGSGEITNDNLLGNIFGRICIESNGINSIENQRTFLSLSKLTKIIVPFLIRF